MTDIPSEFSYSVEVDHVPSKGLNLVLEPDASQREALARRFDIVSLDAFKADCRLHLLAGGPMMRLDARITAIVQQTCVVSGAPLTVKLDETISVEFAPPAMVDENIELTLADADPPDVILNGKIDLGEAVSQQLALAIDPYPRAEGVALEAVLDALPAGRKAVLDRSGPEKPFAALQSLAKSGRQNDE